MTAQRLVLESLPGIGPALARRIVAAYGGLDEFVAACQRLDLERLLEVEGVSERRGFELAAAVRNADHPELVTTDRGLEVRRELEELLSSYAQTAYGQRYVRLLPVLRDDAEIRRSAQRVMSDLERFREWDRAAMVSALSRLSRLKEPRGSSTGRTLVVDGPEDEAQLRSQGFDRWVRIATAQDARTLTLNGIVIDATSEGWDGADTVVRVGAAPRLWRAVPESQLHFVESNRPILEAMRDLAALQRRPSVATGLLAVAPPPESPMSANVASAAQEALALARSTFEAEVATLSLAGSQIMELLTKGLTKSLDTARQKAVLAGREKFRELSSSTADPFEPGLPLRLDEDELERLSDDVDRRQRLAAFEASQKAAATIQSQRDALRDELAASFEFDARYALACFAQDFEARPAQTSARIVLRQAWHARLRRRAGAQPIDYELGGASPLAVLTGANSGGKTSLMEMVAQFVILHHWGLPVPAEEAQLPILRELVFLGATRSSDAGAFESFLRELFPPLTRPGRKLLLLDEVENVTELEAAGRILGVFIDEAAASECLGILVTHLPNEILAHTQTKVRIDGIDAVGLDEKFNLIVDRQPKLNHRARSTPELILRRVHSKSQGAVKELYEKVLGRWR
jgi:hypothetical protein